MKYNKTTRIFAIIVIIMFLFATFGTVIFYIASPKDKPTNTVPVMQPEIISVQTGTTTTTGDNL